MFSFTPLEATLKKSLFPVQRVAIITRAAANSFFPLFFLFGKNMTEIKKKKNRKSKKKKKGSQSAIIMSPGRWIGNKLFFKGGLQNDSYLRVNC